MIRLIKFISSILFICTILSLAILEILAYRQYNIFPFLTSRIWVFSGILYLFVSLIVILVTLISNVKEKKIFGQICLLFVIVVISFKLVSFPLDISGEATQQLASAHQMAERNDFGYTQTAFLGNPSRQFILAALPSLIMGKSILNARLGYLFMFILGMLLFYTGIVRLYEKSNVKTQIGGLAVLSILSFPVIPVLLRTFEQITLPFSFTLQALGWLMIVLNKPKKIYIFSLLYIINILSNAYPPALASWTLLVLIVSFLIFKNIIQNKLNLAFIFLFICLTAVIFFICSLTVRTDIKIPKTDIFFSQGTGKKLVEIIDYFFINNTDMYKQNLPVIGFVMFVPVLSYILSSILGSWGFIHFILSIFISATVIFSGLSPGYAHPPVSFGIHRAIVIMPFILWGISDVLLRFKKNLPVKYIYIFALVTTLYVIRNQIIIYQNWARNPDSRSVILRDVLEIIDKNGVSRNNPIKLISISEENQFSQDHLRYFLPNAKIVHQADCQLFLSQDHNTVIYTDREECSSRLYELTNNISTLTHNTNNKTIFRSYYLNL